MAFQNKERLISTFLTIYEHYQYINEFKNVLNKHKLLEVLPLLGKFCFGTHN